MATIHDVARRAGVSAGTVSNVLNRPSYVGAQTRERVLAAMAELDFVPTKTRRQFRAGRERTLGLAIADLGNPFFADIALGAEAAAKELGVGVLIVHNGEDPSREEQNLDLLIQQRVHGIMIVPVDVRNKGLESLIERGTPLVYVDRISGDHPCCHVASDDFKGGLLAGEHLLGLGHRRIAFIGEDPISVQVLQRAQGLYAAVERAGLPPESVERLPATWTVEEGRRAGQLLADRDPEERPTAVFCANDMLALGVLQEVVRHGVRVPEDLSIVGFDDLIWAGASLVPLTTVWRARQRLGWTAVRMLMDEISEPATHVHEHSLFAPDLIVRESTEKPR
ncbi:LacI family DNA-binding transcriptional regulator [Catenulispora rubra]|uniref:LacI family DNA-binding transcriptional regulator n=1 Tax=Catenulispora rubra TaxID=280293 RepID=UPI001892272B|nr:LacI family DNA-binding transcriptional regulator [Catenulispora rubra]